LRKRGPILLGENMKYYIASSLENAEQVKRLIWLLKSWGWQVTYDWTKHGSVQAEGREVIKETAKKELAGVKEADLVIILLPGGRGTHIEMGAALALGKPVILYAEDNTVLEQTKRICSFYMLADIVVGGIFDLLDKLYLVR
jgi:nucleoside 2-deoxyribosyltransferase